MVSEAVAFKLAMSSASLLYRTWVAKNRPSFGTIGSVDELVVRSHLLPFEQQRARYRISEIGNQLREKLRPVLDQEYGGLARNEAEAAALAVSNAFRTLPLSGESLLSIDFDPGKLESLIAEQEDFQGELKQLNSAGVAYSKRLLRDICNYIIDIVISLPDFTSHATVELLTRDSELLALIQRVLVEIPALDPTRLAATADEDFRVRYMTYVARTLDWLRLFGLDQVGSDSRYGLSIAYITLTAERISSPSVGVEGLPSSSGNYLISDILPELDRHIADAYGSAAQFIKAKELTTQNLAATDHFLLRGVDQDLGLAAEPEQDQYWLQGRFNPLWVQRSLDQMFLSGERLSVDKMLAAGNRLLIIGGAGSGKTTLLQWLAVQAAKTTFQGPLEEWNRYVPFFLQLRRVKDHLPSPGEFLNAVAPNLKDRMPTGWVNRVLETGNALLLIDGVDEVPHRIRTQLRQWISDIHDAFPEVRIIITSRPTAMGEGWLDSLAYSVYRLESLTMPDIVEFVHHWFKSAAANDENPEDLESTRDDLIARISNQPALRQLATTPLLCAMLCALSKSRKGFVPNDRMELYRVALEMLLERRDLERQVQDEGPPLSLRQKLAILQAVSWWFQLSNRSEATFEEVTAVIARGLPLLQGVASDSDQILRQLILRSGVLREPGLGAVDFVHKTFQEYLAAQSAIQDDLGDALIEHAHNDNWREVIIMAAGHAVSFKQCDRLIHGLLNKATDQPRHRHQYHLLAVACLETALQVTPQLRTDVESALRDLVPPRNIKAARELAAAGEAAVPHLDAAAAEKRIPVGKAVATIRCLAMIGGDEALRVLAARFGTDKRITIVRELLRSWLQFDLDSYARTVLYRSPLQEGTLRLQNTRLLPYTVYFEKLTKIFLDVPGGSANLTSISIYPKIASLQLSHEPEITDLSSLAALPILQKLRLHDVGIQRLPEKLPPQLQVLEISACPMLRELNGLEAIQLEQLAIGYCPNLTHLGNINVEELRTARFYDMQGFDLSFLLDARKLSVLSLPTTQGGAGQSQEFIGELTELEYLYVTEVMGSLPDLTHLTKLTSLTLSLVSSVLPPLPPNLRRLSLSGESVSDINSLMACANLKSITFHSMPLLENLDALRALPNLSIVRVLRTPLIDMSALRETLPGVTVHDGYAIR